MRREHPTAASAFYDLDGKSDVRWVYDLAGEWREMEFHMTDGSKRIVYKQSLESDSSQPATVLIAGGLMKSER